MCYKHNNDNITKFCLLRGNNMKIQELEEERGFAGSDALIAILIIALFAGLIASISYNIYLSSSSVKRMSKATGYIVDVFEYVDKSYYDEITKDNLINYFNNKYYYGSDGITQKTGAEVIANKEEINTPFKAEINVTNYNEILGNQDKLDLVKEIAITVKYKLGNKDQEITMKHIKSREKLKTPNAPDFNLLNLEDKTYAYPIKKVNNNWVICDETDGAWYNYEDGKWAVVLKTSKNYSVNAEVDINNLQTGETIYTWIPRYAYDENNKSIVFLYSNSNNYIDEKNQYSNLADISEIKNKNYKTLVDFTKNKEELEGIWTSSSADNAYQILNNIYPLKK